MSHEGIYRIVEETDTHIVQKYLDTKRWVILSVAPGQRDDGSAYHLYSLGWCGPLDPELPENDNSEFPVEPECPTW